MTRFIDKTGRRYGLLLVVKRIANTIHKHARFLCLCNCGKTVEMASNNLSNNPPSSSPYAPDGASGDRQWVENEWYCLSCHSVFLAKEPKCCGETVKFNVSEHGRSLISLSNAWISVWSKWENHPIVRQVTQEWSEDGNYSAAGIFNAAFARMAEPPKESSDD